VSKRVQHARELVACHTSGEGSIAAERALDVRRDVIGMYRCTTLHQRNVLVRGNRFDAQQHLPHPATQGARSDRPFTYCWGIDVRHAFKHYQGPKLGERRA